MAPTTRIAELAAIIQSNTIKFDEYINSHGLPTPSFGIETPPQLFLPEDIAAARTAVVEAIDELHALMLGPMPTIFTEITQKHTNLISLHAISHFNMAESFPVGKTSSIEEIALACGMHKDDTRRIINHAKTNGLFQETEQGVIEHTAGSKAIAQVPLLREWIEVSCKYMWASAPHVVTAMEKWPGSQEPNETGFNLLRQTNLPFFAELIKNPAEMKAFADAMSFFQAGPGMEISLILDHYDWSTHQLVVDVGGSHGKFAVELAKRFPSIQCVVQDLPDVIASAPMLPDHTIGERIRFEAHDFFTEQPIKGADVYFMRMILHDWSDRYATLILKNLIPALKPGARVVINDQVVSESGVLSKYAERSVRSFDLAMKEALNAKERDLEDWTRLFEEADATQKRFQVVDVKRPENSFLQIIEVIWNGGES